MPSNRQTTLMQACRWVEQASLIQVDQVQLERAPFTFSTVTTEDVDAGGNPSLSTTRSTSTCLLLERQRRAA